MQNRAQIIAMLLAQCQSERRTSAITRALRMPGYRVVSAAEASMRSLCWQLWRCQVDLFVSISIFFLYGLS